MERDINDFITIVRQSNGRVRIKHDTHNESKIYELLQDFGYRKTKLGNKRVYFRRQGDEINPVSLLSIKHAFRDFLEQANFSNMPSDIQRDDVLEWYYQYQPIKENGLFDYYLEDTLTEKEAHNFRLLNDPIYKHRFEVEELLLKFQEWSFGQTVDKVGSFCHGNPLYYKRVGVKKFLVFNHYNSHKKTNDGFDSWIASYTDEKQIGNKKPAEVQNVKLSFHLDKDFPLIQKHIG